MPVLTGLHTHDGRTRRFKGSAPNNEKDIIYFFALALASVQLIGAPIDHRFLDHTWAR
jgi:hypothetical protein